MSWRDGLHIKNGRWGILIEECDWDGAASYDDSFAIYSRAQKMVAVDGNTMTITPTFLNKEFFLWKPGDWASVWSPGQEELRGMSRVVSVDGKTGNQAFHVTLEAMPAGAARCVNTTRNWIRRRNGPKTTTTICPSKSRRPI